MRLPLKLRRTIQVLYAIYATGIGVLVLVLAILSVFDIADTQMDADEIGALGLALISPIVPFVHRIVLPGGGGFSWESRERRVMTNLVRGMPEAQASLGDFNLDQMLTGEEPLEDVDG